MPISKSRPHRKSAAGFTLPAILVVVAALLILAVGILLVAGIERNTAHSFADRQRAVLAARAGLEDIRGILTQEAANDDFLILQATEPVSGSNKTPLPYLYLARGSGGGTAVKYRYLPLFSTATLPSTPSSGSTLEAPTPKDLIGGDPKEFTTLPWCDPSKVAWVQIPNANGKIVSRYAYWVEDLQSRVDAGTAGNTKDAGGHMRYGWKAGDTSKFARFPAPGLNAEDSIPASNGRDAEPPLDQVALYALDPAAGAKDDSNLDQTTIDGRKALISPDSALAVAGIAPPLTRMDGHLVDAKARAVEENLTASVQPYDEQPVVPFAKGTDASVTGKPKLNLNALLAKPPADAVDEMAAWINKGLPTFESRKGGFPDNYLKTLAANALDYADTDSDGTVSKGSTSGPDAYRGLDAYPLMSEVILHIKYQGPPATLDGRKVLRWQMIVFVELWNHTNFRTTGKARISYENNMKPPAIGAGVSGANFDAPSLMDDPTQVSPKLDRIGNRYWSAPILIDLSPNQYKFYNAITLNYTMDVGPASQTLQNTFEIYEDGGSSGISLMWNDKEVDRSDKLVRGNNNPDKPQLEYLTNLSKQTGKANIPGHSYGYFNQKTPRDYKNNMGDSRQALYLRGAAYPLSDNAYPGNVSPNRRNIRNPTIYKNGAGQSAVYGRVLPSEWPDGGHDVEVSDLTLAGPPVDNYDPTTISLYPDVKNAIEGDTPTFVSNRGRFFSATELGRIFDPIMFTPTYDDAASTADIRNGFMPSSRVSWPSVEVASSPDIHYGGGNTLRIGRPEHPKFDHPPKHFPADMSGTHAARLLDLFHTGKSRAKTAADREGPVIRIEGHINVNTATEDAIRAMAAGFLVSDPRLVKRTSEIHAASTAAPPVSQLQLSASTTSKEADVLAQAIIRGRPFTSPCEIASALTSDGKLAFGNPLLYPYTLPGKPNISQIQWSDAAAEETFSRVYESSTVRSRNFRVWIVGQCISPTHTSNSSPEILAEVRKAFTVFADPGGRTAEGLIDTHNFHVTLLHENDF